MTKNFFTPVIINYTEWLNDFIQEKSIDFQDDHNEAPFEYVEAWTLYADSEYFRIDLIQSYTEMIVEELESIDI
jgi:hypothetical protein